MENTHLEIERKFLIAYPDTVFLESLKGCSKIEITQTYLKDRIRIRKWYENGNVSYIKTEKKKLSELVRIETEEEVSKEEYELLLRSCDPELNPIIKTRYRYPYMGKVIEIDIFPFWQDRAFLEVELESETDTFSIPDFVSIIKEVTEDKRYRNSALALEIPYDKI